ncbi:beta-ketoacyl synthase N-terminal-like domain-containing protein [Microbispora sp. CA-135349]|uniref:beta-ketoacyl synthase N-terminal-like domain-containing protein n=1 Tax=Microbispora sp. CA-135349 TaxID=3239953 RepID=UPI003D91EEB7
MPDTLLITGWGQVGPAGAGPAGCRPEAAVPLPVTRAFVDPGLDPVNRLGRGTARFIDRTTALTLMACDEAAADADLRIEPMAERVGVTLGTSCGSVAGTAEFIRDSFVNERPHMVNPIKFPNTVINCAAGHAAIRMGAKAINTTVSGGRVSGLLAMRHAQLTLRAGHADALLVGAVEEFTPENAWTAVRGRPRGDDTPLGEAAAMLVLERAAAARPGRRSWAELLAVTVQTFGDPDDRAASHRLGRAALAAAGVPAEEVAVVSLSGTGDPHADADRRRGLAGLFPDPAVRWRDAESIAGDCYSALAAVQLADVLTLRRRDPGLAGRSALVAAFDETGVAAMAVLRFSGSE